MLVRITALALALADAPLPVPIEVPPQPVAPHAPVLAPDAAPVPEPPRERSEPSKGSEPSEGSEPSTDGEPSEPTDEAEPTNVPADDDPFGDHADEEPWPDGDEGEDGEASDAEPLPEYDPLRDSPQALRARHWVGLGIGTLAAGGALLIGSIAMGASDPCNRKWGNSCQPEARNRAALVLGIPAAILLAGGAAMLGVGLARKHRLALDLQAGRTSVGITVRGRF